MCMPRNIVYQLKMDLIIPIVCCDFEKYVIIEFRSSFIKFFAQLCLPFFLFFFFAKVWKGKGEIFLGTNLDAISVKLGIDFNCFVFYRFPAHFLCQTLLDSGVRFQSSKYRCLLGYHI